jgi:hypothetical protein
LLEAADLLDTADLFDTVDLLDAADLLATDCRAIETSDDAFMVDA